MAMKYHSTRGSELVEFETAVMSGLARDGGLFLPQFVPDVRADLAAWSALTYPELALELIGKFADLPRECLRALVAESYASFRHKDVTPVVTLGDLHVLELFHGPTLAFKDVALQFLGRLFEYYLGRTGQTLNILAATSGDTGGAAIAGVRGRSNMRIFVLYPHGRVSPAQERQMAAVPDANVFCIAVRGSFDDCQMIVKKLFGDLAFRDRYALGAVNSINWARVLAQIVYYFYSAFRVQARTGAPAVRFAVPTGNFGDIFAGYLAARMGLPVARLVLATNENDILARFFNTGVYRRGAVRATLSPSMDIQVASNFERYLFYLGGGDPQRVCAWMNAFAQTGELSVPCCAPSGVDPLFAAGSCSEADCLQTMRALQKKYDYLPDPHSAVGLCVADGHLEPGQPMICLATAHPAKFGDAVRRALGEESAPHPILEALADLPLRRTILPPDEQAVRAFIAERVP